MQTWRCTTQGRHLPHTWYYRKTAQWYRCDGQDSQAPENERSNQWWQ